MHSVVTVTCARIPASAPGPPVGAGYPTVTVCGRGGAAPLRLPVGAALPRPYFG
ncbi:MAG: hypothetical protein NZM94_06650 [Roseiflexus sp.]|nr:hypothetical protein [Roseiflexus sp.]